MSGLIDHILQIPPLCKGGFVGSRMSHGVWYIASKPILTRIRSYFGRIGQSWLCVFVRLSII